METMRTMMRIMLRVCEKYWVLVAIIAIILLITRCGGEAVGVVTQVDAVMDAQGGDTSHGDAVANVDLREDGNEDEGSGVCLIPVPSQCKNDWDCTSPPTPCHGNPTCVTNWDGDECARFCEYEDFCSGQACYKGQCCTPDCDGKECGDDGCGGICGLCSGQEACTDGKCVCQPYCDGKDCGPDGCGGSCGVCEGQDSCLVDKCVCQPKCAGKECGPDGCDGVCGVCMGQNECVFDHCVCQPDCEGKECGDDGCGGVCGTCIGANSFCSNGNCVCQPDCTGKECGDNGCGSSCGTCWDWQDECIYGACVCQPDCEGKECGSDGCGGICGPCGDGQTCYQEVCCTLSCEDKNCGPDGCGGTCGMCVGENAVCLIDQTCFCISSCNYKDCGSDGCGGVCGTCLVGYSCNEAQKCAPCEPDCGPWDNYECGPDGCGGVCGVCAENEVCSLAKQCVCVPDCVDKDCGSDGCGGSCGGCYPDTCIDGLCCTPDCEGKTCGPDGCGGICGACMSPYYCWEQTLCVIGYESYSSCYDGNDNDKDGLFDCDDPDCEDTVVADYSTPSFWVCYYTDDPYPVFTKFYGSKCSSEGLGLDIECTSSVYGQAVYVNKCESWDILPPRCSGMTEAWFTVPSGNAKISFSNDGTNLPLEVFYPAEEYPVRPAWDAQGVVLVDDSWKVDPLGGVSQTVYVRYIGPLWEPPPP